MTGHVIHYDGRRLELPVLLEWRVQYACGTPCDSFEVLCPWGAGGDERLAGAVRFEGYEDGKRVFTGVVDEYEYRWSEAGGRLFLAGRGMAALLLDNEALPADYQTATPEDILRDHVSPYGVEVAERAEMPPVPGFSVESGSSEWQVVYSFAKYHGGVEPRFDREGRLLLSPYAAVGKLVVDDKTPVTRVSYREKRYGVLSEVVVLDRARQASQRSVDQGRLDRGYRARRVVCTPGRSTYREMRYSGEFQLRESGAERLELELTLPTAFAAWPGDEVELKRSRPELSGLWRVREMECGADGNGVYTRVVLREK